MDTGPIAYAYDLSCSAERAFDVYVNCIGEWWHPKYTANPETLKAVTIEPGVGGRVYATHNDLGEIDWGRVIVWEPPRRLVHTFTLAQSQNHPSEVSVSFVPNGDGCRVEFEHGGWSEDNVSHRSKFSDWPIILDRFVRLANGTAQTV
jgi:hypothetical protein